MSTSHIEQNVSNNPMVGIIPQWTIADRLRKAREQAGLKQADLAAEIDVSHNTVSNYESSRVEPRMIVLKQWALRTGVPLSWIQEGEVKQETPLLESNGVSGECARRDSNPQPSDPWSGWLAPVIDLFRPRRHLAVAL